MYLTSEFLLHQINDEALSLLGGVVRALSHAEIGVMILVVAYNDDRS